MAEQRSNAHQVSEAGGSTAGELLEVRWMASGNTACVIRATASMSVADVKESVQQQAGVPVEDQHLYDSGRELQGETLVTFLTGGPLTLVRWEADPFATNLGHFHVATNFRPVPDGAFTRLSKIAHSANGGRVYKYVWCRDGLDDCVAVKKLRTDSLRAMVDVEPVERTLHLEGRHRMFAEDPLAEIGILRYLSRQPDLSPHLVRLRGIFAEDGQTWVVTEFAEGGELFNVAAAGSVEERSVRKHTRELLKAVAYLHRHGIGHRDISLENVLLSGDGIVKLTDFGMAVMGRSSSGVPLRFFRTVGKEYYRAPEVYVPPAVEVRAVAPEGLRSNRVAMVRAANGYFCEVRFPPEAVAGEAYQAEVWGYAVAPADVFALGVCVFILAWQCPPWNRALLADRGFVFMYGRGDTSVMQLQTLLRAWGKNELAPEAMDLLISMLQLDPVQRPSAEACLASPWFAGEEDAG